MPLDMTRISKLHRHEAIPALDPDILVGGAPTTSPLPGGMLDNCLIAIVRTDKGRLDYAQPALPGETSYLHKLPRFEGNPIPIAQPAPEFQCNSPDKFLVPTPGINYDPNNENTPGRLLRQTVSLTNPNQCQSSHFRSIGSWPAEAALLAGDPKQFFPDGCDQATWRITASVGATTATLAEGGFSQGLPTGPGQISDPPDAIKTAGSVRIDYNYICPG